MEPKVNLAFRAGPMPHDLLIALQNAVKARFFECQTYRRIRPIFINLANSILPSVTVSLENRARRVREAASESSVGPTSGSVFRPDFRLRSF
jgi:hypothetical protein